MSEIKLEDLDKTTALYRVVKAYQAKWPKTPLTQVKLGKFIGISQASVSDWGNPEKTGPSLRNARQLAPRLDVCVEWLLTGEGPMYPWDVTLRKFPQLEQLVHEWFGLSKLGKAAVTTFVKVLYTQPEMVNEEPNGSDVPERTGKPRRPPPSRTGMY